MSSALDFDPVSITLNPTNKEATKTPTIIIKEDELSLDIDIDSDEEQARAAYVAGRGRVQRRWYQWHANTYTPAERELLIKWTS
jgi:hypothetical protein